MNDSSREQSIPDEQPRSGFWSALSSIWSTAKVLLVSLAIVVPIRAYVAQPFFVRGDSMSPSFHDGEYLIIDELSYHTGLRPLQRGDAVVFRYPLDPSQYYIKRVIGLPGETVRIANGEVTVMNQEFPRGVLLDEADYLPAAQRTEGHVTLTLSERDVLVLGDNRNHSSDSRAWGALSEDLIVGRAWVRAFPFARAGSIEHPWYGLLNAEGGTSVGPS